MLINYTNKELDLMARLMRAEALGEGNLGMLMVGNVIVNRTVADCLTFKNNRTICQEDCDFKGYNTNIRKAKCWCKVEETPLSIKDMKINITKLYTNFLKVENFANFNLLFCYNSLFSKYGIIINIGFFITAAILILHIICMFICFNN